MQRRQVGLSGRGETFDSLLRNRQHQEELQARLQKEGLPCDWSASVQIARWVYQQTDKANGQVWVAKKVLEHRAGVVQWL